MKKDKLQEMRSEYMREELGKGVRGKYLESYHRGTNLVLLSPDVAKYFPSDEAVNKALRSLIDLSRKSVKVANRPAGPSKKSRAGLARYLSCGTEDLSSS